MTRGAVTVMTSLFLATTLTSCAPFGAMTSVATTAVAGTVYVRTQTVERTFVAPMPEVKKACRRALEEMAFTLQGEEAHESGFRFLARASSEYEIVVTLTPITPKATKVSVIADALPERDKATGFEVINQIAIVLSPPPPPDVLASPRNGVNHNGGEPQMIRTSPHLPPMPVMVRSHRVPDGTPPSAPQDGLAQIPPRPSVIPAQVRPAAAKPEPPAARVIPPRETPQTMSPRRPEPEAAVDRQRLYEDAIGAYIRGDFVAADAQLRRFLATRPDNSARPRALYWLGESLYNRQEYADALLQFETILQDYPQSPEAPRALLKGAQAYRQLHETRQATALLQTLITRHPTSREAQVAQALMAGWK